MTVSSAGDGTMTSMKRSALVIALLLAACTAAACTTGTDQSAGCVQPSLLVSRADPAAGDSLRVNGEYFLSECGDTIENGVASTDKGMEEPITLYLVQGDTRTKLGQAQADAETGNFAVELTIPRDTQAGPARIETDVKVSGSAGITVRN
jgi:hypothetical protein